MKKFFYLFSLILFIGIFFVLPQKTQAAIQITNPANNPAVLSATKDSPYSFRFQATGDSNYNWRVANWARFPITRCGTGAQAKTPQQIGGLSLNSTGLLSGTPNNLTGIFGFIVYVNDVSNSVNICLTISSPTGAPPSAEFQITTPSLPDVIVDQQYGGLSGFTLNTANGTAPYVWTSLNKPGWLTLSAGVLSGTPQIQGETPTFTIRVQDNQGRIAEKSFSIRVNPPSGTGVPPPGGGTIPSPGSTGGVGRACSSLMAIQNPNLYQAGNKTAAYDGLVPCGKCVVVTTGSLETIKSQVKNNNNQITGSGQYVSCQFCHFFVMFGGIVNFLIWKIAIPAAILLLVIGGAMFVFAAGKPGLIKKGKDIMTSVAIGLIIMFVAWLAVNTIFAFLGVADWTGLQQGWFQINCPIKI